MTTPIHSRQTLADGIHGTVAYTYVTSASLAAATGFNSYDLYKLALVTGDNSLWILINNSPTTWKALGTLSGSVSTLTGSGGTSVSNLGGDYTVSSSVGAAPENPFITWAAASGLTNENILTASGGTSLAIGGGFITVSSSVPQVQKVTGAGSITVTQDNTTWIVSSSAGGTTAVSGTGGTTVTGTGDVLNPYFVSSSIPLVQRLVGQGAVAVTAPVYPDTTWIISGSGGGGGGSTYVQGTGSVSVTGDGSLSTPFIVSASVIQVSGTGGTTVATSADASRFVISSSAPIIESLAGAGGTAVSNSGKAYTISSSIGAQPELKFVVGGTAIPASLPNSLLLSNSAGIGLSGGTVSLHISGLGGIGISTGSYGNIIVSSSAPVVESIAGTGAVVVSNTGTAYTVSASVVTVAGAGGTTVTNGGGTTYTVSSSAPIIESLAGAGGTAVSNSGKAYTISSSIGAPPEATYLTLNAHASLTQERVLTAGKGIAFVDGGANSTLTVKIDETGFADVSASYVTIGLTGSLPNERKLTAGTGISIVDGGAGGNVTISATGGSTADVYRVTASYVVDSRAGTTDYFLLVSASAHNITCSLPAPTSGRVLVFKDLGSGSSFPWQVAPVSSAKIDTFSASYTWQSTFGSLRFVSDGTDWFIT